MTPDEVLHFWFAGDPSVRRKIWFEKNIAFDSGCNRFVDTLFQAKLGRLDDWAETPHGALALLIVLDQMSRNLHRGTAETYAADVKARGVARAALARQVSISRSARSSACSFTCRLCIPRTSPTRTMRRV